MSVVGYVTIEEANAYVASRYASVDADRLRWEGLSDDDKAVYLLRSVEAFEGLPFQGRKAVLTQTYAFPRYFGSREYYTDFDALSIPDDVKNAQVENALALSDGDTSSAQYEKMKLYGVTAYSISDFSETLSGGGTGHLGVTSSKASQMLQKYISGGYGIR